MKHNVSLSLITHAVNQYGGAAATGTYTLVWEADVDDAAWTDAIAYGLALAEARFDCTLSEGQTVMSEPSGEMDVLRWVVTGLEGMLTLASIPVPSL